MLNRFEYTMLLSIWGFASTDFKNTFRTDYRNPCLPAWISVWLNFIKFWFLMKLPTWDQHDYDMFVHGIGSSIPFKVHYSVHALYWELQASYSSSSCFLFSSIMVPVSVFVFVSIFWWIGVCYSSGVFMFLSLFSQCCSINIFIFCGWWCFFVDPNLCFESKFSTILINVMIQVSCSYPSQYYSYRSLSVFTISRF